MADGTDVTEGQAPIDTQTTDTTDQYTEPAQGQAPASDDFDKERALATIRNLRAYEKQAKEQAKLLAEYQRKEEEARQATLSEQQRLAEQVRAREAELEQERLINRDRMNRYEVQLHASRLGIVDPEAAEKLLDWKSLEYEEDGRPRDIEGALRALTEAKPYLVQQVESAPQPRQPANPTNPATRTPPTASRTYTTAEIADRAFYKANEVDIIRAMREGRIRD